MKTDAEIADEAERGMEEAMADLENAQIAISQIFAATMLYTYSKWLGMRYSSKAFVQEFLEEQGANIL